MGPTEELTTADKQATDEPTTPKTPDTTPVATKPSSEKVVDGLTMAMWQEHARLTRTNPFSHSGR